MQQINQTYEPCYFANTRLMPSCFRKEYNGNDKVFVFDKDKVNMHLDHVDISKFCTCFFP